MATTICPAACPCRTSDPSNERLLADEMLGRCACGDLFHLDADMKGRACPACAEDDEPATVAVPFETMNEMVFGKEAA